jgi:hypothetical protein
MSLAFCPECGKAVTPDEAACEACGRVLRSEAKKGRMGRFHGTMMMTAPSGLPHAEPANTNGQLPAAQTQVVGTTATADTSPRSSMPAMAKRSSLPPSAKQASNAGPSAKQRPALSARPNPLQSKATMLGPAAPQAQPTPSAQQSKQATVLGSPLTPTTPRSKPPLAAPANNNGIPQSVAPPKHQSVPAPIPQRVANAGRHDSVQPGPSSVRTTSARSDSVRPEGMRAANVQPEGVRPASVRPTGAASDSVRTTGVRSDSVRTTGVRSETSRTTKQAQSVRPSDMRSGAARPDGSRPLDVRAEGPHAHSFQREPARPMSVPPDSVRPVVGATKPSAERPTAAQGSGSASMREVQSLPLGAGSGRTITPRPAAKDVVPTSANIILAADAHKPLALGLDAARIVQAIPEVTATVVEPMEVRADAVTVPRTYVPGEMEPPSAAARSPRARPTPFAPEHPEDEHEANYVILYWAVCVAVVAAVAALAFRWL